MLLSYNLRKSAKECSGFFLLAVLVGCSVWLTHSSAANLTQRSLSRRPDQQSGSHTCTTCPAPSERRIYAPAIDLDEAGTCEIVLNSRSPHPIDVTPIFYTTNGHEVVGNRVQLQPAEIRFVKVESLIPQSYRGQHRWGGIALSYVGGVLEVWAQITFHGVGGIGSIDETFNIVGAPGSDTSEAVWSMPKGGRAVIALGNSSETSVHTTAQFSDGSAEEFEIAPFATKFIRRQADGRGKEETINDSVKLTTIGPPGSLRVAGFNVCERNRFTSSIRFYDTKSAAQPNLYATNLRLKNTAPRMTLKNTGEVALTASPQFFAADGDNPVVLPNITLEPGQIVSVDLSALTTAAAGRSDLDSVSAQVLNSGSPGSLIGAVYSTDNSTSMVYDVPLRDSGGVRNSTGSYPWRVDDDYTTIVNLTNVSNHAASFIVDIRYSGGHYFIPTKTLPVGGSATFDLRKIIDEQTPDNRGTVIPSTTIGGQFHWSVFGGPMDSRFIGRSEVVSLFNRVSSSYSCPACCPDSGPYGDFRCPGDVPVDGYADVTTTGYTMDCNGWMTDMGSLGLESIWMDDPSIASVSPAYGGSTGIEGLQAGSTYLEGSWHSRDWVSDGWSLCFGSENENTISCDTVVTPEIASISPDHGPVGTTVAINIFGTGFSQTGTNTILVSGSGVTASDPPNFINSGLLSVTLTIASDAAAGNHTVRVMTNGSIGNGVHFFVQVPTRFERFDYPGISNGYGPLTLTSSTSNEVRNAVGSVLLTNQCGVYRNLVYELKDQQGDAITQPFDFTESFSNYSGVDTTPGPRNGHSSEGLVQDTSYFGKILPACPGANDSESFDQTFTVTIGTSQYNLTTVVHFSRGRSSGNWFNDLTTTTP